METFILVIFLKFGYAGGVVTIPSFSHAECVEAVIAASKQYSYQDAFCVKAPKR